MTTAQDQSLDQLIAAQMPRLIEIRHDLHAHPQLGYEETHASGVVQRELKALGIAFEAGLAETGVVGWIEPPDTDDAAPAIGLRADMDALPITEETGLPYTSTNPGLMHACGHDGHTTILIGAARVLSRLRDRLRRPIKLVFQPAEESLAGAARMIEDGALEQRIGGRAISHMFGLHGMPYLPLGAVTTRPGPIMAATGTFTITVTGRGGHAAMPHVTADPIVAASQIISALQTVVARNVTPTDSAVVSVTAINGGTIWNVIPESVEMIGTYRTLAEPVAHLVKRRIDQIARQVAAGLDCTADAALRDGYPVTHNDPAAAAYAMDAARQAVGPQHVMDMPRPIMGGEDFSFYGRRVPSCFSFIGLRPKDREEYPGLHTAQFDFTDDAIAIGVKLMCQYALNAANLPCADSASASR